MRLRAPIVALCLLLGSLGLVACGGSAGGGSSVSSVSSASPAPSSGSSTSTATAPSSRSRLAPAPSAASGPQRSSAASETAAQRRAAGRAAPFVKSQADNSVPTFGAEASATQRAAAEASLKAYLQARASGDWATACRYLSVSTRQGFERLAKGKAGCAPVLRALSKGADLSDPLGGKLLSLRVHGANAFALFYGPHRQQYILPMNREGGRWRPTQTAPIAYPIGSQTQTSP